MHEKVEEGMGRGREGEGKEGNFTYLTQDNVLEALAFRISTMSSNLCEDDTFQ